MKFKLAESRTRAAKYFWAGNGYLMRREPKPFAHLSGRQRVKARKRDQRLRRKLFHEVMANVSHEANPR